MQLCLGCQIWDLTTLPTRDAPVNDTLLEPTPEPLFNPMSPEVIADPYPYYHRLREADPVHRSPLGFFVASRHADVAHVLRDKCFGKDFVGRMTRRFGDKIMEEPVYRSMGHWMLQQDPPDHTRLRGLVVKAFTARRVEDMRPRIQEIVDATLDRVEAQGRMDLIADFAFRLPVTVICEMLGIPKGEHEMFFHGARTGGRLLDPVPLSRAEIDEANAGSLAQAEYFHALFELRRRQPGEDLTSQLVQAEEQGAKLSNEELTANIILLFGAGHETTVNLIGNGLLALYRNPDQLQRLQRDPALIGNAIEEFLRYDSSVQLTGRTALEDVEVGGTPVAKGESVLCLLGAANRDPAAYPDPDRLDIARPNIRPLSFGGGIHFCLGAQLARIEGEIAIATLLRRLPNLRVDDPEHADWRQTFVLRGLNRLPASW
jgi:cytochrome P450